MYQENLKDIKLQIDFFTILKNTMKCLTSFC